jgi:hypothetical protein
LPIRLRRALLAVALGLGASACSSLAADVAAGFLGSGSNTLRGYFDYESAGHAAGTAILQFEALHGASPDNEDLTLMLAKSYIAYAFGWVMDDYEAAQFAGRFEEADHQKQRAYLMYRRARDLTLRAMRVRDDGIDKVVHGDPDRLMAYLREEYDDPEDDVELLLWTGVAWGSTINNAPGMDEMVDLPAAKAIALRAIELDPGYENGAALGLLGGFECSYPEALGGDWKKGRAYFERALSASGRRDHIHLFNYARTYAINSLDKPLFVSLMREILDSGDRGADVRMSNKVARRRAARYLAHMSEWFE